ncbi:CHAT domain-containing protein [Kovacikia minuta CCNUW1]|uniref:CHAT domain-containing protein n=1 Tax=Kovacikia minuta TaxID=2931930 RepID=UPI001CCC1C59|nr:CHAT domain-containing tetratricopeptide repeat protein [Kovacikia minuta]UBF29001.1 CHAT domain-containing protein [Kovacikia minuta CCNUW1]
MKLAKVGRSSIHPLFILSAFFVSVLGTGSILFPSCINTVSAQTEGTTADQLFHQGNKQYQSGQFEAALTSWQQARRLYQQNRDSQGEGTVLANLGTAYISLERYKEAIATLKIFLPMTRTRSDRRDEAQTLGNLGIAYKALGYYGQALEAHKQAGRIFRAIGDRQGLGQALLNLGNTFEAIGDYDNATIAYQQSLKIAQQTGIRTTEGIALGNLGTIYANFGKYEDAIAAFERSLKIAQSIQNRSGEASTLINLGSVQHTQGNRAKALDYYQAALTIAQTTGDRQRQSEALGSLGLVYEDAKQYPQAIDYLQKSLAIARTLKNPALEGTALNNLGHALFSAGKLAEAETQLQTAIQLLDSLRFNLSDTYQVSIFDTQLQTYNLLQQVRVAANKPEAALEVSEQGRARAFAELLARKQGGEGRCQVSGVRCPEPEARSQETGNGGRRADGRQKVAYLPPTTYHLPPTIESIKQIARQQNATLVEYAIVPDDDFKFRGKQRAKESELLIWVVSPTGKVAFRRVDLKPLWQKGATLSEIVRVSRCLVPAANCGPVAEAIRGIGVVDSPANVPQDNPTKKPIRKQPGLRKLYDLLIQPIADLLPTDPNAHVIFIPQESLFLAPFVALQDSNGTYLIEKHTLLTAPSIQVLELTRQQRERRDGGWGRGDENEIIHPSSLLPHPSLVVGNPTMPSVSLQPGQQPQPLSPLPGAEQEAIQIAKLLKTKALIGEKATKTVVVEQMANAEIIHLATHGLLEYGSQGNYVSLQGLGVPGAIALAPTPGPSSISQQKEGDGLLTADEILNLRLKAKLVVLSACDTGQGRITGDGVIGLSRAFISAGASTVIVSLWAVPDAPTAELMTTFYQNLQTNPDKARALRQAMLETMKIYPRPLAWAAFTLIGEAE